MTMQFHNAKDTRRTTQLQRHSALSAYPEEQQQEEEEEAEREDVGGKLDEDGRARAVLSIDQQHDPEQTGRPGHEDDDEAYVDDELFEEVN